MSRLFGTDGVRGIANRQLTPELAFQLGKAAAAVLLEKKERATVLLGKDPRASGDMLEASLAAGFMSGGADVLSIGVVPTPAVAYLTKHLTVEAGAMISASHNPVEDNGIKFFSHQGFKLPDSIEDAIEHYINETHSVNDRPIGKQVGKWMHQPEEVEGYLSALIRSVGDCSLRGKKIVLDCANGSASPFAESIFRSLGAEVITLHATPNGENINHKCGSTHPESLGEAVVSNNADFGFAFDGDADRCLAVDEKGCLVDGDQIMTFLAIQWKKQARLSKNTLVVTVMSNLGLRKALEEHDIQLEITSVGDRYVLEAMLAKQYSLGGEQSGHLIFADYATTGDGMLTALQFSKLLQQNKMTMSQAAATMQRFPQVLHNVRVENKNISMQSQAFLEAIRQEEEKLGRKGRILVRPSGTEQLIRIMVEAEHETEAKEIAERLSKYIVQ